MLRVLAPGPAPDHPRRSGVSCARRALTARPWRAPCSSTTTSSQRDPEVQMRRHAEPCRGGRLAPRVLAAGAPGRPARGPGRRVAASGALSEAVAAGAAGRPGPARPRHRGVRRPAAEPLHRAASTRSSRGSRCCTARARCRRAAARSWLQRLRAARAARTTTSACRRRRRTASARSSSSSPQYSVSKERSRRRSSTTSTR